LPQILNRPNDPPKIEDHFKIRISLHTREDPSQNRRTLEGETKNLLNVYLSPAKRMPSSTSLSVFSTSSVTCLCCSSPAMNLKTRTVKDQTILLSADGPIIVDGH
jgi:hypothetical protein